MDFRMTIVEVVFAICILAATVSDIRTGQVYRFLWWIAEGCALIRIICIGIGYTLWLELAVYFLIQETLFARLYGRADVKAFETFAMMLCSGGFGIRYALYHMYFSFLLLALVQAFRRNINRKGNLKRPVAFIPYITIGFLCLIFCIKGAIVNNVL